MSQPEAPPELRPIREDPKPAKLSSLILGAILAVLAAAGAGYLVFLFVLETYKLVPAEAARTAVTLIGVPTAAGAVFVALRNLRVKERQLHTDQLRLADAAATYTPAYDSEHKRREVDQERELRGRYVSASEQMGHESAAVRLAGVNAMAQLADDWADQRQARVDVLCAYLRLPQLVESDGRLSAADGEVRRTVQQLIAQGFKRSKGTAGLTKWPNLDLDLRGAVLVDCRMPRVAAVKASFVDAKFQGSTTFIGSTFVNASFTGAVFDGAVTFSGCEFGRVLFLRTTFRSTARFKRSVFSGMANFVEATFRSQLDLKDAQSRKRILFSGTSFAEHPPYTGDGYKVVIRHCNINQDPIPDMNVPQRATAQGSELDDWESLEEDEYFESKLDEDI